MLAHSRASPCEGRLRDLHSIWRVHDASIPSGSVWDATKQPLIHSPITRTKYLHPPMQHQRE